MFMLLPIDFEFFLKKGFCGDCSNEQTPDRPTKHSSGKGCGGAGTHLCCSHCDLGLVVSKGLEGSCGDKEIGLGVV